MSSYRLLAQVYDDLMKEAPYDAWLELTLEAVNGRKVERVLDLGCGTGEFTLRLAKYFPHLYGVDLSNDMLTIARHKAETERVEATWIQQDLRQLEGFNGIDLAVSYCDVLNYIVSLEDIKKVFQNVYASLAPGGLFIFDIHSIHYVEEHLLHHTFAYQEDELAYIWDCVPGKYRGEMFHELSFFFAKDVDSSTYYRFDEVHHQRTYPSASYVDLLHQAGFRNIEVFADFSMKNNFLEDKSERIFILSEK